MPTRPNVVLIMVDQWRGDCLSVADHPVVHTPYLDQLALRGVRFTRAYSATPTCIPARAALFTGLGQRSHGRITPVTGGRTLRALLEALGEVHRFMADDQDGFEWPEWCGSASRTTDSICQGSRWFTTPIMAGFR